MRRAASWLGALALLAAALWLLSFVVFAASGGVDCGESCSDWANATGAAAVVSAYATIVLVPVALVTAAAAWLIERRRR